MGSGFLLWPTLPFVNISIRVATRSELLSDGLLSEFHVHASATRVVLNLVAQALASSADRTDISDLELGEADSRVEVEALGS